MAARQLDFAELNSALREIFPDGELTMQPSHVRGNVPAIGVDVHAGSEHVRLRVEVLSDASGARVQDAAELLRVSKHERDALPVLYARHFSPAKQELLRAARTSFIDGSGNAWLTAPRLHVDRRGFKNLDPEQRERRDPFSDKASLILRTLMREHSPLGVRQIAEIVNSQDEHIGLTPGYVSKVAKELEHRGYAGKREEKIVLRRVDELLRDWLVTYRKRKQPMSQSYFIAAPSAELLMPGLAEMFALHHIAYVFTGQAGASLVDRHAEFDVVDVYVRNLEKADEALSAAGARQVERGGNVNVMLPFYRVSAFYDAQTPKDRMSVASDIQLYLDLYDYPVRGREQADHLYERRLRHMIERTGEL